MGGVTVDCESLDQVAWIIRQFSPGLGSESAPALESAPPPEKTVSLVSQFWGSCTVKERAWLTALGQGPATLKELGVRLGQTSIPQVAAYLASTRQKAERLGLTYKDVVEVTDPGTDGEPDPAQRSRWTYQLGELLREEPSLARTLAGGASAKPKDPR